MKKWDELFIGEEKEEYYIKLMRFLEEEYNTYNVFPPRDDIFNAFNLTDFNDVKVVILGQDPYHEQGQAHGLSFSVQPGIAVPPSLKNIYTELSDDMKIEIPRDGNLTTWSREGVLLLNTVLTVREGEANSHKNQGWEIFTNKVIESISKEREHVVFILWGKSAQTRKRMIDDSKHLILEAPHPSPLSSYRGFFGSKPFSKVNEYLTHNNIKPISWG